MDSLSVYEIMSGLTRQMVDAAHDDRWDRLGELEREVAMLRDRLITEDPLDAAPLQMDARARARKVELIQGMLADDREIRSYTEPWMRSVRNLLYGNAKERIVRMAYSSRER
ncbi:MAG TPA: flagellar protein FliT [Rhodocyclaceae bacterium]|nr:flagellar protein FliT [Rhodocyclaceae bacterium]